MWCESSYGNCDFLDRDICAAPLRKHMIILREPVRMQPLLTNQRDQFFSQSVSLTQYVVLSVSLPVCLPVPVSFWRGFVDNTNV